MKCRKWIDFQIWISILCQGEESWQEVDYKSDAPEISLAPFFSARVLLYTRVGQYFVNVCICVCARISMCGSACTMNGPHSYRSHAEASKTLKQNLTQTPHHNLKTNAIKQDERDPPSTTWSNMYDKNIGVSWTRYETM